MSVFKEPPVLVLETMEDVRTAIETPDWRKSLGNNWPLVKSTWVISLIDEIEDTGHYPYNCVVKKAAEQRLGYRLQPDSYYSVEGDALSALIYNAQCYRRSDQLTADGFVPFTHSVIALAGIGGQITGKSGNVLSVREVEGRLYAMKKGSKKYVVQPEGQAVKITKWGKQRQSPKIGERAELLVPAIALRHDERTTLTIGTTGTLTEKNGDQFYFVADHEQGGTFILAHEVRVIPAIKATA